MQRVFLANPPRTSNSFGTVLLMAEMNYTNWPVQSIPRHECNRTPPAVIYLLLVVDSAVPSSTPNMSFVIVCACDIFHEPWSMLTPIATLSISHYFSRQTCHGKVWGKMNFLLHNFSFFRRKPSYEMNYSANSFSQLLGKHEKKLVRSVVERRKKLCNENNSICRLRSSTYLHVYARETILHDYNLRCSSPLNHCFLSAFCENSPESPSDLKIRWKKFANCNAAFEIPADTLVNFYSEFEQHVKDKLGSKVPFVNLPSKFLIVSRLATSALFFYFFNRLCVLFLTKLCLLSLNFSFEFMKKMRIDWPPKAHRILWTAEYRNRKDFTQYDRPLSK